MGETTLVEELHQLMFYIKKLRTSEEWKTSVIVQVCTKGDKSDYNNSRGISLGITAKILQSVE